MRLSIFLMVALHGCTNPALAFKGDDDDPCPKCHSTYAACVHDQFLKIYGKTIDLKQVKDIADKCKAERLKCTSENRCMNK